MSVSTEPLMLWIMLLMLSMLNQRSHSSTHITRFLNCINHFASSVNFCFLGLSCNIVSWFSTCHLTFYVCLVTFNVWLFFFFSLLTLKLLVFPDYIINTLGFSFYPVSLWNRSTFKVVILTCILKIPDCMLPLQDIAVKRHFSENFKLVCSNVQ